jgi:ribosome-associated translation inhibitor RaiA
MQDKKLSLSGFNLDASEKEKVNEVLQKYLGKIEDRVKTYDELKLRLKKSMHGKSFLHEIEGDLIMKGNIISSKETDYNLYVALAGVFEKILAEIEHMFRKR